MMMDALSRARDHRHSGRLAEAAAACRTILRAEPDNREALQLLARVLQEAGEPKEALACLLEAARRQPQDAYYHAMLGDAYRDLENFEAAAEAYRRSLALRSDHKVSHNLGLTFDQIGDWHAAEASYRRSIELKPDYFRSHRNLGRLLARKGDRRAAASYRRSIELKPDARSHVELAQVLRSEGDLEAAAGHYRKALALDPGAYRTRHRLANLYIEMGKLNEAMAELEATLALKPGFAPALDQVQLLATYLPKTRRAAPASVAQRHTDGQTLLEDGIALWEQGKAAEAVDVLTRLHQKQPRAADVCYYLGLAHKSKGDPATALAYLERASEMTPGHVYAEAAQASIRAEQATSAWPRSSRRVALHIFQPHHYQILRPLFDLFAKHHPSVLTPNVRELVEFEPDVVIVSDSQACLLRPTLPDALYVWIRHGLISKHTACDAARVADYACLSSEWVRDWQIAHGGVPRRDFWITGYVQMDPLFREERLPIGLDLPTDHRVVLYAPTVNEDLSSAAMLGKRVGELVRGDRNDVSLIIKPHPVTPARHPTWMKVWRSLGEADPHVHLIEEPTVDIVPYLKTADVLISDVSSVAFQYLALNRPIILINNPNRERSRHYDPSGIEWTWRDLSDEIHDIERLPAAVNRALSGGDAQAERRAHYRRLLFGDLTDGRAAERILERVSALAL